MQRKVVHAGTNQVSSREASENLAAVGELEIDQRQVQRVVQRSARELLEQRDEDLARYESQPLMQKLSSPLETSPQVVAISLDGGTMQIRSQSHDASENGADPPTVYEETAPVPGETAAPDADTSLAEDRILTDEDDLEELAEELEEKSKQRHWREFKAACLQVLESEQHATDPFPNVPATFLDRPRVTKLAREIHNVAAPAGETFQRTGGGEDESLHGPPPNEPLPEAVVDGSGSAADSAGMPKQAQRHYKGPEVKSRRVVATRKPADQFGRLVAMTAWRLGFAAAARKAFIGDGSSWLWKIQRRLFSRYVPILDFIHLLGYIFEAAHAGLAADAGWSCYTQWVQLAWGGRVDELETSLAARIENLSEDTDARGRVATALTYIRNHREYMNYPEYRRQGLPITSSHIESTVKQLGRRVKGTEKFWKNEGAEGILHLRSLYLSTDEPMNDYWPNREQQTTGHRSYRRAA